MNKPIGNNALEFTDKILTPEEIAQSNLRVAIIEKIIKTKRKK